MMAKEAGKLMPNVHLFSSQKGAGYLAVNALIEIAKNDFTCILQVDRHIAILEPLPLITKIY